MKSKLDFVAFLQQISNQMQKSAAETNLSTDAFLGGLAAWLKDSEETGPTNFDWDFAAELIRAGIYYE